MPVARAVRHESMIAGAQRDTPRPRRAHERGRAAALQSRRQESRLVLEPGFNLLPCVADEVFDVVHGPSPWATIVWVMLGQSQVAPAQKRARSEERRVGKECRT